MTRKILSVLFVSMFVFAVAQVASAQDAAVAEPAPEAAVVAPCSDCVVPMCGARCCAPCCAPCCDPCGPPIIGYRRGFLGICRPVYAPVCDPCYVPYCPPRFYRPWRPAYCW